ARSMVQAPSAPEAARLSRSAHPRAHHRSRWAGAADACAPRPEGVGCMGRTTYALGRSDHELPGMGGGTSMSLSERLAAAAEARARAEQAGTTVEQLHQLGLRVPPVDLRLADPEPEPATRTILITGS